MPNWRMITRLKDGGTWDGIAFIIEEKGKYPKYVYWWEPTKGWLQLTDTKWIVINAQR